MSATSDVSCSREDASGFAGKTRPSQTVHRAAKFKYSEMKLRIPRLKRRRTSPSGTKCPPMRTRFRTRSIACSGLSNHRKCNSISKPLLRASSNRRTYVLPLSVLSMANVSCFRTHSLNSVKRMRPALTAELAGSRGDKPRAISSAFRKRKHLTSFGKNSIANVVLPAPLQPAIR